MKPGTLFNSERIAARCTELKARKERKLKKDIKKYYNTHKRFSFDFVTYLRRKYAKSQTELGKYFEDFLESKIQ